MPNALRVILWSILSLGLLFLAVMAFWVFLIIIGVVIVARLIYVKLFHKGTPNRGFTIRTYTMKTTPTGSDQPKEDSNGNENYTTVIDAEDPDKEYRIPRIK